MTMYPLMGCTEKIPNASNGELVRYLAWLPAAIPEFSNWTAPHIRRQVRAGASADGGA